MLESGWICWHATTPMPYNQRLVLLDWRFLFRRTRCQDEDVKAVARYAQELLYEVVIFPLSAAAALARASFLLHAISSLVLVCSRAAPRVSLSLTLVPFLTASSNRL